MHFEPEGGDFGGVFDDERFVDFEVVDVDSWEVGVEATVVAPDVGCYCYGHAGGDVLGGGFVAWGWGSHSV